MRARGFTLMELMVAIALAAVIAAATTSAFIGLYRAQKRLEQQAEADQEAKFLLDVILARAQQAGGEQIRPWDAIIVEDNCATPMSIGGVTVPACSGGTVRSDRLHMLALNNNIPQAKLLTGPPGAEDGSVFRGAGSGSSCSLTTAHQGVTGILVAPSGGMRAASCGSFNGPSCHCTDPGSAAGFDSSGSVNFDGGVFAAGAIHTYYLENGVLKIVTDADGDGIAEVLELADRVADFQVDYGFDTDGDFIVDAFSGVVDAAHPRTSIRMLRVGVILDVPTPARDQESRARLAGGEEKVRARGAYLYATQARVLLRNLDLFF